MCIRLCHASSFLNQTSGTINRLQIFTAAMQLSSGSNITFTTPDDTLQFCEQDSLICTSRRFPGRYFIACSLFESCSVLNMLEQLRLIDYLFVSLPVMLLRRSTSLSSKALSTSTLCWCRRRSACERPVRFCYVHIIAAFICMVTNNRKKGNNNLTSLLLGPDETLTLPNLFHFLPFITTSP